MKKILLTFLTIVSFIYIGFSQNVNSVIKTQAMDMAKALLKKDYTTFSRYMHPQITEAAGGKNKLIQQMDTASAVAAKFGAEIKKVLIGNPSAVVKFNKELQATLPQYTEMKTNFGNLTLESTLVAISPDNGKNWYFIDTSVFGAQELKKSLPNLSPQLVIPPTKPPKFTPAE
jgi:hypothetical protein